MEINDVIEEVEVQLTKAGKVRKRKPKKKNVYFTQETEDAIVSYISETNQIKRERIYRDKIHYAFYKLSENIIHTFKFYYTEVDDIEDLKFEVISFLIQKLHLFNHSKYVNDRLNKIIVKEFKEEYENSSFISYTDNSASVSKETIDEFISSLSVSDDCKRVLFEIYPPKAYSYFGTIAKRYLIIYNSKNYKKLMSQTQIENTEEGENAINKLVELPEKTEVDRESLLVSFIETIEANFDKIFTSQEESKVADAILTVFKKRENIDIFNKKALFVYIKEIIDTDSNSITKVIKTMKKVYSTMLNDRLENCDE
jgi:hypothetical protein